MKPGPGIADFTAYDLLINPPVIAYLYCCCFRKTRITLMQYKNNVPVWADQLQKEEKSCIFYYHSMWIGFGLVISSQKPLPNFSPMVWTKKRPSCDDLQILKWLYISGTNVDTVSTNIQVTHDFYLISQVLLPSHCNLFLIPVKLSQVYH